MSLNTTRVSRLGAGIKILEEPLRSIQEFESWRHSVIFNLRLDGEFRPYLAEGFVFGAKTRSKPSRDLRDTTGDHAKSKELKCQEVDLMLEHIAQYCPKIPFNDIAKDCASLDEVWQVVRLHSNIETSGALLNNAWNITRLPNESPQALYSRLKQAYDDNLIRKSTIKYKDQVLTEDEEMTPTLHCTIILHWLQILHPKLRDLVTQRFCTELRNSSYAAIWPEICRSVDILLKEVSSEDGAVCKFGDSPGYDKYSAQRYGTSNSSQRSRGSYQRFRGNSSRRPNQSFRYCDYCRVLGRHSYHTHSIENCHFLKKERQDIPQARCFQADEYDEYDEHLEEFYSEYPSELNSQDQPSDVKKVTALNHIINKISVNASPSITMYLDNSPYDITIDTGGTCNAVDDQTASKMNCSIRSTHQGAWMADGQTMLDVIGETDIDFNRHGKVFRLTALVCRMAPSIIGGMPFLIQNDISIRPARAELILAGSEVVKYSTSIPTKNLARRLNSYTVRCPSDQVILPGEVASFAIPKHVCPNEPVAVEPRYDNAHNSITTKSWPIPKVHEVHDGYLTLANTSEYPVQLKKNSHVCNILPPVTDHEIPPEVSQTVQQLIPSKKIEDYSTPVQVNPDGVLNNEDESKFRALIKQYDEVFNPKVSTYNGKSGACFVQVNMGPIPPPQHKGRIPFYGRDNLIELQQKFDTLAAKGVFRRPQDMGVTVEVINPSFLVKKKSSSDKRLVTDFGAIADYCRPTPGLMPDVDSTLRQIATWKYLITSDLTDAYFQL